MKTLILYNDKHFYIPWRRNV